MANRNFQSQGSYDQARQPDQNADWDRGEYRDRNQGYVGRDGLQPMQNSEGPEARYRGQGEQPPYNSGRGGWQGQSWEQTGQRNRGMDQYNSPSAQTDYGYDRPGYAQDMGRQGGYQGGFSQGQGGYSPDWGDGRQNDGMRGSPSWQGGSESGAWQGNDQRYQRSHRGRGPKNYQRSDDRIYDDVCDRLSDDHHVDASDIEVSVSDREVTLSGEVDSKQAKRQAEDCADSCSGVEHVQNNLRVQKSQSNAATEDVATARET